MRVIFALLLSLSMAAGAAAQVPAPGDEAAIRAVIATWYSELQKGPERKHWRLYAPMAVDGGPGETEINPHSRARSPTYSNELAASALQFTYDIDFASIRAAPVCFSTPLQSPYDWGKRADRLAATPYSPPSSGTSDPIHERFEEQSQKGLDVDRA